MDRKKNKTERLKKRKKEKMKETKTNTTKQIIYMVPSINSKDIASHTHMNTTFTTITNDIKHQYCLSVNVLRKTCSSFVSRNFPQNWWQKQNIKFRCELHTSNRMRTWATLQQIQKTKYQKMKTLPYTTKSWRRSSKKYFNGLKVLRHFLH